MFEQFCCVYLINWLAVHVCASMLFSTECAVAFVKDWSVAAGCTRSKREWDGVTVSGFYFIYFSHLRTFDVSHHKAEWEALMCSTLVRRRTKLQSDFSDESCQGHRLHSRIQENPIASEPFVTNEQLIWVLDLRRNDNCRQDKWGKCYLTSKTILKFKVMSNYLYATYFTITVDN